MDYNQFDDMKGIFNSSSATSIKQLEETNVEAKGRIFSEHFKSLWVWPILALLVSCQPAAQEWSVRELGPDRFEIQAKDLILGAETGKMSLQTPAGTLDWGFSDAAAVRPESKGQELEYRELYQNVDFKLYHKGNGFAGYDLILRPGARVEEIWMDLAGEVNEIYIDANGELVQPVTGGALRHSAPISFQDIDGERHLVESAFRLEAGKVGFSLGDYDPKHVVVIDPKMYFEEEEFFFRSQNLVDNLECNSSTCPTPFPEVSNIAPGGPDRGRDNNYNVIVGGDVTVTTAGEMEGKVFIGGDLFMNRTQSYNMGYVGLGSGVVPDNNTVWVTVGGNVEVPNFPTARILGPAGGGSIYFGEFRAGGSLQNTPADANGPGASPDPIEFETVNFNSTVDAMTPNNLLSDMASLSSCLATQAASPTSDVIFSESFGTYTITEVSEANFYVIDITAQIGPSFGATFNFVDFENDGSETIIFNVDYPTSGDAVKIDISTTTINGMPVIVDVPSGSAPSFQLREGILWNIPDASSVLLGSGTGGGTIDGSFFIPGSSVTTTMTAAGLNGRFYAAGDLIHGGNGSEFHAYPFRGSLPCISNNLPYDLALRKTVSTTQTLPYDFDPGETVAFDITVINQGQVDASNVTVEDYAPAELTFATITTVNPVITDLGNTATIGGTGTNVDPFTINTLLAGDAVTFTVTYTIAASASGTLSNFAEITGPNTPTDEDSTPNNNAGGDPNLVDDEVAGFGGDEDDHDIAVVEICPAQTATEICLGGANEEILTAPSGSGETNYQWYVREGMTITEITGNTNQTSLNINAATLNAAPFSLGLSAGTTYEFYYTYDDAQDCQQSLCCPLDILVVNCFDFGDLPDNDMAGAYPTNLTDGAGEGVGPSHIIDPDLYIGILIDDETDGSPSAAATGDDNAAGINITNGSADDEDGFTAPTFTAGQSASFTVPVFNNTGSNAELYAWFDWNNDGTLDNATERYQPTGGIISSSAGTQTASFSFTVPPTATVGSDLGVRFRLSTDLTAVDDPTGAATDGEVEDYLIQIQNPSNLSLGNLVFFDRNNDGLFDADGADNIAGNADDEFGFDGVTVNLYEDTNNDGTPDGAAVATQTTMSGGSYLFTNLTPNNYIVEVIPPAGYNSSTGADAATGTYEGSAPDPDANNDPNNDDNGEENAGVIRSAPVTLTVNGEPTNDGDADNNSNLAVDFGLIGYNLGNVVFYDENNNGQRDAGEAGIAGVTLELLDANNSDAAVNEPGTTTAYTVTTDANGQYLFEGIPAGNYKVRISAAEFGSGETLENYLVSSGAAQQDNPESAGGIDEDANGIVPANPADAASNGVVSGTIAIGTGFAEPEDEDPQDPNVPGTGGETFPDGRSNMTLDFGVYQADFGDLPNNGAAAGTDYAVANADNGPSHIIIDDLRIGATVDAELDGQASSDAMGDDSGSPDDEDGVDFLNVNIQPGNTIRIPATVVNNTGGAATFYGFIDWNNNGVFDAGEASTPITVTSTAGSQTLLVEFNVPTDAQGLAIGASIGARFRLSTDSGLGANGAASNGEVEDYLITTIPCPVGNCFDVQIVTNN